MFLTVEIIDVLIVVIRPKIKNQLKLLNPPPPWKRSLKARIINKIMPFEDTREGTTHYYGDNCGCPEHNQVDTPGGIPREECYCNDDRGSGYFKNGHFTNCPQYRDSPTLAALLADVEQEIDLEFQVGSKLNTLDGLKSIVCTHLTKVFEAGQKYPAYMDVSSWKKIGEDRGYFDYFSNK